ncbi:MAG TPA: glutamyl-tRNA reductase, partial [Thermoanaerobaculia bacterium]|nr:glutamyl-tRNA reductase [Thermoanaerobaculia bacterium]
MTGALPLEREPQRERDPLPLLLLGVDHRTAPVGVREKLAVPEARLPESVRALMEIDGLTGACVLSTCNRVELILSGDAERVRDEAVRWLAARGGVGPDELAEHLYEFRGAAAVEHLCRVASGLESMIVGEPQIAGQVKKAFAASREAGALDALLHRVAEQAMRVAKKIRS